METTRKTPHGADEKRNLPAQVKTLIVKRRKFLIVAAAFCLLGGTLLARSQAATFSTAIEAEAGQQSGKIGAGPTSGASGNASVTFGGTAGGGTNPNPTTPPPSTPPSDDVKATSCTGAKPMPTAVTGYTIKKCEDFNGSGIPSGWTAYNGGGGDTVYGAGRQASQCKVADGILKQSQQTNGATCGMSSNFGGKYGYWEVKMKAYGGKGAHPVLIVWPDSDKWPEGGELDFFEADIGGKAGVFLHCASSKGGNCYHTTSDVDFSQWHVWGFEWTASSFTGYIDGEKWYTTNDKGPQMPGAGHLTIQLDNLSGRAPSATAYMDIDWARYYSK